MPAPRLLRFRTRPAGRSSTLRQRLDLGYAQAGLPPPVVRLIAPDRIPPPYAALLVHDADMRRTLERHDGGLLLVRALATWLRRGWYCRRVLLVQDASGRPVAMGAIRVRLDALASRMRARVLRGRVPLGRIPLDGGLEYRSGPPTFFEVTPDSEMMGVFWMREPRTAA